MIDGKHFPEALGDLFRFKKNFAHPFAPFFSFRNNFNITHSVPQDTFLKDLMLFFKLKRAVLTTFFNLH